MTAPAGTPPAAATGGPVLQLQDVNTYYGAIHALRKESNVITREKAICSIRSRIAYVKQFNPGSAKRLSRYLESVLALR